MENKLKELRREKQLSQEELAKMVGVNQNSISSWEVGRTTPKPYQMQFIADLFGVKVQAIFFGAFNYKTKLKSK